MKRARVRLYWVVSPSNDVVRQRLHVNVNSEDLEPVDLGPLVNEYEVVLDEFDVVSVVVVTEDGTYEVPSEALNFVVPDLNRPLAATGLGYELVEVFDVDEE